MAQFHVADFQLILGLILIVGKSSAEHCPAARTVRICDGDWIPAWPGPSCIKLVQYRRNWTAARDDCRAMGADLVYIQGEAHLEYIYETGVRNSTEYDHLQLIGLSDRKEEGKFVFLNETEPLSWTNWHPGQPEHADLLDCVRFEINNGLWESHKCEVATEFICEKEKVGGVCEPGWSDLGECIRPGPKRMTWTDAVNACKKWGSTLLTVRSQRKQKQLDDFLSKDTRHVYFIGARTHIDRHLRWLDGPMVMIPYTGRNREQKCTAQSKADKKILFRKCAEKLKFVCQKFSNIGPYTPTMKVTYHVRPSIVFHGIVLEATCRVRGVFVDALSWTFFKNGRMVRNLEMERVNESTIRVENEDGLCLNESSSTLRIVVTQALNGSRLACYGSRQIKFKEIECFPDLKNTVCNHSLELIAIAGPKSRPTLTTGHTGEPDPIKPGDIIRAECSGFVEDGGRLFWVMYLKSKVKLLSPNDLRIVSHSRQKPNASETLAQELVDYINSTLEIRMTRWISGIHIACFSYDPVRVGPGLFCNDTDLFCLKSPKYTVKPKGPPDEPTFKGLEMWWWLLILVASLALITAALHGYGTPDSGEGEEPPMKKTSIMSWRNSKSSMKRASERKSKASVQQKPDQREVDQDMGGEEKKINEEN